MQRRTSEELRKDTRLLVERIRGVYESMMTLSRAGAEVPQSVFVAFAAAARRARVTLEQRADADEPATREMAALAKSIEALTEATLTIYGRDDAQAITRIELYAVLAGHLTRELASQAGVDITTHGPETSPPRQQS